MSLLIDNWYIILGLLAVIAAIVFGIIKYFNLPTAEQIACFKEWLKFAVVEAERCLGEKTGQLKLRYVYDMAVQSFPWVAKAISFELFSVWVDDALIWMRHQLENNTAVKNHIEWGE